MDNKDLRGVLFKNNKKEEGSKQPDYTGSVLVNGKEWRLAGWKELSSKGTKYLSLRLSEPMEQQAPQPQRSQPAKAEPEFDQDIPF